MAARPAQFGKTRQTGDRRNDPFHLTAGGERIVASDVVAGRRQIEQGGLGPD